MFICRTMLSYNWIQLSSVAVIIPNHPRPRYLRYILSAAYATGAINMDETIPGDALIIGLGGGSANNYLRHATKNINVTVVEIDPTSVDLAKTYFGFNEDERQRCVEEDGAIYIRKCAKRGQKFDLIISDTSQENNTYVQAPSDSFLKLSVVRYFPEILKKTGVLIMNCLTSKILSVEKVSDF
ncbi:unnamed protein product [Dracunculus medinensis]|uniref:PABS domain-containing protein n=1 Tax=Dracunculus medinensis TaxID=318479 RepID=A0A0N4U6B0_DRAME|nr:unnamed protein product [Dracunculus medinensis]